MKQENSIQTIWRITWKYIGVIGLFWLFACAVAALVYLWKQQRRTFWILIGLSFIGALFDAPVALVLGAIIYFSWKMRHVPINSATETLLLSGTKHGTTERFTRLRHYKRKKQRKKLASLLVELLKKPNNTDTPSTQDAGYFDEFQLETLEEPAVANKLTSRPTTKGAKSPGGHRRPGKAFV